MTTVVYKLVDMNGRDRYVGITDNPDGRSHRHRRLKKEHVMIVLSEHGTRFEAGMEEVRLIKELRTHVSNGGWNKTWGGEDANISGVSRKGIGGRKKGSVGKTWVPSDEVRAKWSSQRKGKSTKTSLDESSVVALIELYKSKPVIDGVGKNSKNGRPISYEQAFVTLYTPVGMTPKAARNIIEGKVLAWKHLL